MQYWLDQIRVQTRRPGPGALVPNGMLPWELQASSSKLQSKPQGSPKPGQRDRRRDRHGALVRVLHVRLFGVHD